MIVKANNESPIFGGMTQRRIIKERSADLPLITVITATYNSDKYIEQCILSIIHQTYPNIEYIIIDGGSKDNTIQILMKYDQKIDFWVSESDEGVYEAWNKALLRASGEWVCFIGSDDYFWNNEVIEKIYPVLDESFKKGIKFVYGKINQITAKDCEIIDELGEPWENIKDRFLKVNTLAHCASFHHKELFKEHGFFDASFQIAGDYEFLLRELKNKGRNAFFVDMVVAGMRTGGISGSLEKRLVMAKETQKARSINGFKKVSMPIFIWILRIKIYTIFYKLFGTTFSSQLADFYRVLFGKQKRWTK